LATRHTLDTLSSRRIDWVAELEKRVFDDEGRCAPSSIVDVRAECYKYLFYNGTDDYSDIGDIKPVMLPGALLRDARAQVDAADPELRAADEVHVITYSLGYCVWAALDLSSTYPNIASVAHIAPFSTLPYLDSCDFRGGAKVRLPSNGAVFASVFDPLVRTSAFDSVCVLRLFDPLRYVTGLLIHLLIWLHPSPYIYGTRLAPSSTARTLSALAIVCGDPRTGAAPHSRAR
jgi:hypothetical protein